MSVRKLKRRMSTTLLLDASMRVDTNRHMGSLTLEPLEDMVTCPIDLNFLVDPRLLPCGHAFCCDCLTGYMSKLKVDATSREEAATFACPICRAACSLPSDRRGESLQKAFNHTVILEFVRNTQLAGLDATSSSTAATPSTTTTTPGGGRKNSMQVSSHMLNLIVQDITTRQRDGKVSVTDRTVILDEVNRLVSQLQISGANDKELPMPPPDLPRKQSSTASSVSPSNSTKNLGRFYRFAARIRSPLPYRKLQSNSSQLQKQKDCSDVNRTRATMKRNACYCVIAKISEHDLMHSDFEFQPTDGYHNIVRRPSLSSTSALLLERFFLTVDKSQTNLILRRQVVSPRLARARREDARHNGLDQDELTYTAPLKFHEAKHVQVQYLRIIGQYIYLTAVTHQQHPMQNIERSDAVQDGNRTPEEFGFLIRCSTKEFNKVIHSEMPQTGDGRAAFPVNSVSCFFKRDEVGVASRQHPLVFGLDVDRSSGDIYVTQPANGMICRLKPDGLDQIDATWYFNDSQLSPYFLCYAASTNSVWATCPSEGKIVILDLETNGLFQFTPSVCFGITPSHVVYTTDHRIVVLDKRQSCLYWVTKVDQTICFQSIQVKTKSKLPQHLTVIQPAADIFLPHTNGVQKTLTGGVFCIGDSGCLLIYPKKQFDRHKHTYKVCFR